MPRFTEHLENPLPGTDWYLSKLKHHQPVGVEDWEWLVQLKRKGDGVQVEFRHADLFLTWLRAVEAAYAHEKGIFEAAPLEDRDFSVPHHPV